MSTATDVLWRWIQERQARLAALMYGDTKREPGALDRPTLAESWNGATTDRHDLAVEGAILAAVRQAVITAEAAARDEVQS